MKVRTIDLEKVQRCPVCNAPLVRISKRYVCPDGLEHTKLMFLGDNVRRAHERAVKGAQLMDISAVAHKHTKPRRPARYTVDSKPGLFARCYGGRHDAIIVRVATNDGWSLFAVAPVEADQ